MHALLFAVCVCLVPTCPEPSQADDAKKQAELEWARGVADDFLVALRNGDTRGASGLLTAEYANSIAGKGSASEYLDQLHATSYEATLTGASIAPDRDEVRLTGRLESSHATVVWTSALVMRVVKE